MGGRAKDDPYAGLYYAGAMPGGGKLSDVRVSLPAMNGMHVLDVLNYLSLISGISLIIDPYTFDEPFGGPRPPKVPEDSDGQATGDGYRPADIFSPQLARPGTVIGNFVNVPFDVALELILSVHGLEYVVYDSQGNAQHGGGGFTKPVVLITNRERLEQELAGQNEIDIHAMHYADPYQVTDMLDDLNLLPGTNSGWYIYRGSGGGFGGGTGGGGGFGGGSGGGGMGGAARAPSPALEVYRGGTREPVQQRVQAAVESGADVIRVVLAPEDTGMLVTAFAQ
jgi:uncharacterized membrane protein YgcG